MQLKMFLDEAAPQAATAASDRRTSSTTAAIPAASSSSIVPFDALRYTAGECNYGGRVTDDKDRLLLSTILSTCYCQDLVNLGSSYSFSASGLYHPPEDGPRESYLAHIDALPIQQAPEAFGLHANAAITKDINDTQLMLSSLLAMSGGGGSSGGSAAEAAAVEARVAGLIHECLEKLPAPFNLEAVGAKFPVSYGQSLNTVLVQEMARYNKLCVVIRESLRSIAAALKGLLVMSSELEAAYESISLNQVCCLLYDDVMVLLCQQTTNSLWSCRTATKHALAAWIVATKQLASFTAAAGVASLHMLPSSCALHMLCRMPCFGNVFPAIFIESNSTSCHAVPCCTMLPACRCLSCGRL
jgi:dynein heavy chain